MLDVLKKSSKRENFKIWNNQVYWFYKRAENLKYSELKVLHFGNSNINNVSERWYVVCHTSSICGVEHWIRNEMDLSNLAENTIVSRIDKILNIHRFYQFCSQLRSVQILWDRPAHSWKTNIHLLKLKGDISKWTIFNASKWYLICANPREIWLFLTWSPPTHLVRVAASGA